MLSVIARTSLPYQEFVGFDANANELAVVVLKTSHRFSGEWIESPEEQAPIILADQFRGEPAVLSMSQNSHIENLPWTSS